MAAEHAEFALTEVTLGLVPDAGGLLRLPGRLPRPIAVELLLTGRRLHRRRGGPVGAGQPGRSRRRASCPPRASWPRAVCAAAPLPWRRRWRSCVRPRPAVGAATAIQRGGGLPAYRAMLGSRRRRARAPWRSPSAARPSGRAGDRAGPPGPGPARHRRAHGARGLDRLQRPHDGRLLRASRSPRRPTRSWTTLGPAPPTGSRPAPASTRSRATCAYFSSVRAGARLRYSLAAARRRRQADARRSTG